MRITSSAVSKVAGLLAGAVLVLSCDGSPGNADAAMCDCPAAESPIAGRVMILDDMETIAPNSRGGPGVQCPEGALRLGGSCTASDSIMPPNITLEQSGFYRDSPRLWQCKFKNNENTPVMVKASVICLLPGS